METHKYDPGVFRCRILLGYFQKHFSHALKPCLPTQMVFLEDPLISFGVMSVMEPKS